MSDLHLEFQTYDIPHLDTDSKTVLVLAGDIHIKDRAETSSWLEDLSKRFFHIIRILGNHEHYRSTLEVTAQKIKDAVAAKNLHNVSVLDNESVTLISINGPIHFVGSTLWTDFNKADPITMYASAALSDYKLIRWDNYNRKLSAQYILGQHREAKRFIIDAVSNNIFPTVVVSHHAPHDYSVGAQYKNDYHMNGCYRSDLSDIMLDHPHIKLWVHGHMHDQVDYTIGDTRVICNPRGYLPDEPNDDFNPTFLVSVNDVQ